jgi:hypothetical protein
MFQNCYSCSSFKESIHKKARHFSVTGFLYGLVIPVELSVTALRSLIFNYVSYYQ